MSDEDHPPRTSKRKKSDWALLAGTGVLTAATVYFGADDRPRRAGRGYASSKKLTATEIEQVLEPVREYLADATDGFATNFSQVAPPDLAKEHSDNAQTAMNKATAILADNDASVTKALFRELERKKNRSPDRQSPEYKALERVISDLGRFMEDRFRMTPGDFGVE